MPKAWYVCVPILLRMKGQAIEKNTKSQRRGLVRLVRTGKSSKTY